MQDITTQQIRIIEQLDHHTEQVAGLENDVMELRNDTTSISIQINVSY